MSPFRATARSAVLAAAVLAAVALGASLSPASASAAVAPASDDTPHVIVEPDEVLIPEGRFGSFGVRLSHPPSGTVYLGIRISGTGVWASPPVLLMFTPNDWSTPKPYGVASVSDADRDDAVAVVTASVSGYLPDTVTLRQIDDD